MPSYLTADFETDAIQARPDYPPKPIGLAVRPSSKRASKYLTDKQDSYNAWGQGLLDGAEFIFHNAKFDLEVAEKHLKHGLPKWQQIHDTMFLVFLLTPHAKSYGLKQSAEALLDEPPTEQDELRGWILGNVWRASDDNNHLVTCSRADRPKGFRALPPTKAMAYIKYAPTKLVSKYAKGDTDRTYNLFKYCFKEVKRRGMLDAYNRERRLLPTLLANEQQGVRVDYKNLTKDLREYYRAQLRADNYLRKRLDDKYLNIDSDQDLADRLEEFGVVTEWQYTAKSGQKSVSKDNLKISQFKDAKVFKALGYRNRLKTCISTFMAPWEKMATENDGNIHTSWNQVRQVGSGSGGVGARTGRLSSSPNFMNIPTEFEGKGDGYQHPTFLRVEPLPLMRRYLIADRGHKLIHADYSQQELRILAHFENGPLLREFKKNPKLDVHTLVQELILQATGVSYPRKYIKVINFGIIYGMGVKLLADKTGLSVEDTRALRQAHAKALPGVYELDMEIKNTFRKGEPIRTWGGREYYCEPPAVIGGVKRTFEYKGLNYLIQGSAADCTKEAIIRFDENKKDSRFWITVHDEINISCPTGAVKQEKKILKEAMQSVEFDLPMFVDMSTGFRWSDCK